ncbi:MAG TPA: DegV family protein [Thermoanaerobaculia bacterium]|jgi:DegV family protein with EDD domain
MTVHEAKAVARPAVLIVEAEDDRRHALSRGLAAMGYDVTPAMTAEEGLKFARGLGPSVIVGPVDLLAAGGAEILEYCVPGHAVERTIVLLGAAADGPELPDEVRFLPIEGLTDEEILLRVQLVLVGRELGVEPDLALSSLVGDLTLAPMLELVRSLHRCRVSGRLELAGGFVAFDHGAVAAAGVQGLRPAAARLGAAAVRGVKAFCRLARQTTGPFRIVLGPPGEPSGDVGEKIDEEVPELVVRALEESLIAPPPPRTRLRVVSGAPVPTGQFATHQNLLLEVVSRCDTVEELLDSVPSTDGRLLRALDKLAASGFVKLERPRSAVAILTDSTADLPPEVAAEHDLTVVPLSVAFGDDVLRDGVDIQARDFYQMLETDERHPSTRPPTEAEIHEHLLTLLEERDVVAVHVSGRLSQTLANAGEASRKARAEAGHRLVLVDSKSVSMGVGLLALFAARMAFRGEGAPAIASRLADMASRVHVLFVVDTLEYLERGGRIGKAQSWVGKLLGIKPILGLVDGEIVPIDRVRGGRQAHPRMVKLFQERLEPGRAVVAAVVHARAPAWADRLRALVAQSFDVRELFVTDAGPVVGTHAGPGCVGAVLFQPSDEEWELVAPLDRQAP